jgi:hypothetical protein
MLEDGTSVTKCQASIALGLHKDVIQKLIRGGLPYHIVGKQKRLNLHETRQWLIDHPVQKNDAGRRQWKKLVPRAFEGRGGVIYLITDSLTGKVRYIGKATDFKRRVFAHRKDLRLGTHCNQHLQRWHDKLVKAGGEPIYTIVQEVLPGMLNEVEREWIAKGRTKGWQLCNITDGGDGADGKPWSDEEKRAASEATRKKWADPEYRKRQRLGSLAQGRTVSDEERVRRNTERERNIAINARNMALNAERKADRESFKTLTYLTCKGVAYVPLTRGQYATIDADDAQAVGQHVWYAAHKCGKWKPRRTLNGGITQTLARFILGIALKIAIRSRDGNQLNCRRSNLFVGSAWGNR